MTFRRKKDAIHARFRPEEIDVIRMVMTETSELIASDTRSDPAVERLFPDLYADDPIVAAELRQYTEGDLREGKLAAAEVVLDTLDRHTRLTDEQADAWLRALNDVRLALGVRLGVVDDCDLVREHHQADAQRQLQIQIYGYLSYLQESLVETLQ